MKKVWCVSLVALLAVVSGCGESPRTTSTPPPVNNPFSVLDAYGQWIEFPEYGEVWQPRVGYDWQPFVEGRWVWTDRGWLWHSEEPFGWVVYHYGYWVQEGAAGWLWVPGNDWSPARVRWVVRDDMIGWAPMPPPGRQLPVAVEARSWVVVTPRQFTERNVGRYRSSLPHADIAPREEHGSRQPDVDLVERATNAKVDKVQLETEHVNAGDRQLIRMRIPESSTGAIPPPVTSGTNPSHPPAAPSVPPPQRLPDVARPSKPVPPVNPGRRDVVRSRRPEPAKNHEQTRKPQLKVEKEKKVKQTKNGETPAKAAHEKKNEGRTQEVDAGRK